ncbi:hypothetical protein [Kiloniella sp. EL199]|uniref:hypothetical protein n=1 Tax=Kiloniella sp. EL199 TaxID=2107581 RepID=UPI000EA3C6A7|nr:hypothetical protein [Kiloniella sp. EL199]
MQDLNLDIFTMINATSDAALWLIDWGRFLSWWPQLIAVSGLLILVLSKNDDIIEGILPVISTIVVATGINHLVAWAYPLVTPGDISVGYSWMRGTSLGQWMGPYPIFLFTLILACMIWFRRFVFCSTLFCLGIANAWGTILVGNYFPFQILMGMVIGVFSSLLVVLFVRGQKRLRYYFTSNQENLKTMT